MGTQDQEIKKGILDTLSFGEAPSLTDTQIIDESRYNVQKLLAEPGKETHTSSMGDYYGEEGNLVPLGSNDPFDINNPPIENPERFLAFLKWYNSPSRIDVEATLYQEEGRKRNQGINPMIYSRIWTSEELAAAIKWAKQKGIDPRSMSPAQIQSAVDIIGNPEFYREQTERNRTRGAKKQRIKQRLLEQKGQLLNLLALDNESGSVLVHSTSRELLPKIMETGLICGRTNNSVRHTALALEPLRSPLTDEAREKTMRNNAESLSEPHRDRPCTIVFLLPSMTPEQINEMKEEGRDVPSFFLEESTDGSYVLPKKYIQGYIDQETGDFHPNI